MAWQGGGMPRVRASGTAFLPGLLLIVVIIIVGGPAFATSDLVAPALHGIVTDALGGALGQVEILVLGDAAAEAPLAVARSDDHGRFIVDGLAPGIYRVAAVKEGYLAFLGRFNTMFRPSLDMVLRPAPPESSGAAVPPKDASWILRLPERSLLRETDASVLLRREPDAAARVAGSALYDNLEGRVDHLVDLSVPLPGSPRENTGAGGAETRMSMASAIGRIASVRVRGERQSFDRVATKNGEEESASRDASSFFVEASCATGRDANLAMKASYAQGDLDVIGGASSPDGGFRHARRSWGYDATWSTQLDEASRLAVKVGYLDTLASLPEGRFVGAAFAGADGSRRPFLSRAMAAGGSYESLAAMRHQVRVDVEATLQDLPLPRSLAAGDGIAVMPASPAGWNVRVRAEDQWVLSAPLALVYGLGYVRGSDARQTSVVEPRVGGVWTDGAWRARLVVLYDLSTAGATPPWSDVPEPPGIRRAPAFGYDAEVDVRLPWGLGLKGARSFEPVAFDAAGAVFERIDPGFTPLYAADGSVSAERNSLTFSREAGGVTTYLKLISGSADGTLAQVFPFEVPLQLLADRRLRYDGARVGVRVAASGTDVSAEFRRVEDTAAIDPGAERTAQEFVEFQLAQDLLRGEPRGMSWRFLFAARTAPQRQAADADPPAAAGLRTLAALSRRVSAGLSLTF